MKTNKIKSILKTVVILVIAIVVMLFVVTPAVAFLQRQTFFMVRQDVCARANVIVDKENNVEVSRTEITDVRPVYVCNF
jgi:hypothetical protein